MSILSRLKKVASAVKKNVSSAYNAVKTAIGVGSNNTASVINASPTTTKAATSGTINAVQVPASVGKPGSASYNAFVASNPQGTQIPTGGGSSGINSSGGVGATTYGPQLPVTISGGKASTSKITAPPDYLGSMFNQSALTGPITTSRLSYAGGTTQGAVQGGGGSTGGTYANSPYSVPPQYKSIDPGKIDTTNLAGGMSQYYTRKDDGTFEPVTKDLFAEKSDAEIAKEKAQLYKDAFGDPQSVYEDSQVKQAQADRRAAQEALLAPTAQLNAVLSQAQRDTLQLRQTAQKEGVVEAVYGAQAAAINYNAAIQALPLQSHIAALQNNLELADSYLNELVTIKKEQIDRQYQYNKGLFDTIYSALDAKEKRVADRLIKENDRQYKAENELVDYKAELIAAVNAQGDPNGHVRISAIERAKDKISAANAAGNLTSVKDRLANEKAQNELNGTEVGDYTPKQLSAITKLNQDVSKNSTYVKTTSMRNYGDNVVASLSLGSGVGDISAINQFQKVIDEGAVTRDQDVALIQASQSFANTLKTKIKKLEKGEQLSPELRSQMRLAVETMYDKQVEALLKDPYISAKKKEASLYGLGIDDTILGELETFSNNSSSQMSEEQQLLDNGYTQQQIEQIKNAK